MCGIVGTVSAASAPDPRPLLASMCAALAHRGPDSRGLHVGDGVGLGIQRLRVIDLDGGDQPIYNEDRSVAIVLNGEIYNYRELRERLERSGHRFATRGDTETIVHLYEEEGDRCVESLHGMFAFALWDAKRRRLLIGRDRVGKKPLFYALRDGTLTFASELAALMRDDRIPREIDHDAVDAYLAYQCVPAPLTIYRGVRKLPPAHILTFADGAVSTERYWRLDYSRKRTFVRPEEVGEEIRAAIRKAVAQRMVADVPLGAFLSGGVDSSAVVAAMSELSSTPVKTFSIGFPNPAFDETSYARQVATLFATEHHEFIVEPHAIEIAPTLVRHYGEPFADASAIPSFYLSEFTRRHVTVALNGDGGDESFAGYQRYVAARAPRIPPPLRSALARAGAAIPAKGEPASFRDRLRDHLGSLPLPESERYARQMSFFSPAARERLYTDSYRELVSDSPTAAVIDDAWRAASGASSTDVMLEVDVETYLPNDLLVKIDIATMAYGLEARSPLLDHELMELAASLPPALKLRGSEKKVALRDALRGWVPDGVLDRPKMGFGVPLADWFRVELRDYVRDVLLDPGTLARGYFAERTVRALIDDHEASRADHANRLWSLLMFELWHREFIDRH